jgi:small-conductance mechanosensitive channel
VASRIKENRRLAESGTLSALGTSLDSTLAEQSNLDESLSGESRAKSGRLQDRLRQQQRNQQQRPSYRSISRGINESSLTGDVSLIISEELKKQQQLPSNGDMSVEVIKAVKSVSDWWQTNIAFTSSATEDSTTMVADHALIGTTSKELDGGDGSGMNTNSKDSKYDEESSHEHSHSLERRDSSVESLDQFDPSISPQSAPTLEAWTSARSSELDVMRVKMMLSRAPSLSVLSNFISRALFLFITFSRKA